MMNYKEKNFMDEKKNEKVEELEEKDKEEKKKEKDIIEENPTVPDGMNILLENN